RDGEREHEGDRGGGQGKFAHGRERASERSRRKRDATNGPLPQNVSQEERRRTRLSMRAMPSPEEEKDDSTPVLRGLDAATGEIFRERAPYEDAGPRDSAPMRWAKFASIIAMLALLFGAGFALEDYLVENANVSWSRSDAVATRLNRLQNDSAER